eukprot:3965269-Alexandrium_andersonii.AAC.1
MAAAVHPLAAKTALYAAEPVAWKGGLLRPIYKGKGPPAACAGSRAVVCEPRPSVPGGLARAR